MAKNLRNLIFLIFLFFIQTTNSQSFLGVNYGEVANNLPPPEATAKLLKSTSFSKVRLYGTDPLIIKALANTGIGIVIGAANGDIPALALDPNHATQWVASNVLAFPDSNIILITIGNEVISSGDQNLISQLLPAMQNVQNALNAANLGGKIKVSTVHSMAVMGQSDPPSAGAFNSAYADTMKQLLDFQSKNGSPLTINPYPFFAYRDDPRPETLAFCLFQPNAGRVDSGTNIKYMNMFDAQVDAIHSALNAIGYKDIEIVVAETGWPYRGDSNEVGPSIENAKAYNGGLISHLRSKVGTPLMPGKSVDTYIFALYDEDLKFGPTSERSFGIFKPDLSMTYDLDISHTSSQAPTSTSSKSPMTNFTSPAPTNTPSAPSISPTPTTVTPITASPTSTPSTPSTSPAPGTITPITASPTSTPSAPSKTPTPVSPSPKSSGSWCVPKQGASNAQLLANINYICGQGIDCRNIMPGGPCFEPNTMASHASYVMNLYYQKAGRTPESCNFTQTATITSDNPSYASCVYHTDGNAKVSVGVSVQKGAATRANFSGHWFWLWCLCFLFLPRP